MTNISLSLTLTQPSKPTDQYYIKLFTISTGTKCSCFDLDPVTLEATGTLSLGKKADYLHAYLYLTTQDDDESDHTKEVMLDSFGSILISELRTHTNIYLKDIIDQQQGIVTIHFIDGLDSPITSLNLRHSISLTHGIENDILPESLERINLFMNKYNSDSQQQFRSFTSPIGELPILCYPLLAYRNIFLDDHKDLKTLLETLYQLSIELMGISSVEENDFETIGNLLGTMVTLINRCQIYQNDYTRSITNSNDLIQTDAWTPLFSFPRKLQHLIGFDCEDAAEMVLELLYGLIFCEFSSDSPLKVLQEFISHYMICCTLTKLITSEEDSINGYVPHCCVTMIDREFYQDVMINEGKNRKYKYPGLLMEGTTYSESVFSSSSSSKETRIEPEEDDFFIQEGEEHWRKILKNQLSTQKSIQEHTYGEIARLLIIEPNGKKPISIHLATLDSSGTRFGLEMNDFLFYKCNSNQFQMIEKWDSSKSLQMISRICEIPLSCFPSCSSSSHPSSTFSTYSENHQARFILRDIDYKQFKYQIQKSLRDCYGENCQLNIIKREIGKDGLAFVVLEIL